MMSLIIRALIISLHASVAVLLMSLICQVQAVPNMRMHGALVAEPCVIPPGEESISLDFNSVVDKYLYLNSRTIGQVFEISLTDCDLGLGSTVEVTFSGAESAELTGLLAIDPSSTASGIALGLETVDGRPLPLNQSSAKLQLQTGRNVIALKAYVQGEPTAITDNNIVPGTFSAIATFSLQYE